MDVELLRNSVKNRKFFSWTDDLWTQLKDAGNTGKKTPKSYDLSPEFFRLFAHSVSELSPKNALKLWHDFNTNFHPTDKLFLTLFALFLSHCHVLVWEASVEKLIKTTLSMLRIDSLGNRLAIYDVYCQVLNELVTLKLRLLPVGTVNFAPDSSIYDLSDLLDAAAAHHPEIDSENDSRVLLSLYKMSFIKYKFLQIHSFSPKRCKQLSKIVDFIIDEQIVNEPELLKELLPEVSCDDLHRLIHFILNTTAGTETSFLLRSLPLMSEPRIQTAFITVFIKSLWEQISTISPPTTPSATLGATLQALSDSPKSWHKHADRQPNPADPEMDKIVRKLREAAEGMLDQTLYPDASDGRVLEAFESLPAYSLFWEHFPIEYLTRLNQSRLLIVATWLTNHVFQHCPASVSNKKSIIFQLLRRFLDINFRIWGGTRGVWFTEFLPQQDAFICTLVRAFDHFRPSIIDNEQFSTQMFTVLNIYLSVIYRRQQQADVRERFSKQVFRSLKALTDGQHDDDDDRDNDGVSSKKKRKKGEPEGTAKLSLASIAMLMLQTQNSKFLSYIKHSPTGERKAYEKLESKLSVRNWQLLSTLPARSVGTFELLALREFFEQKLSHGKKEKKKDNKNNKKAKVEMENSCKETEAEDEEMKWPEVLDRIVSSMVAETSDPEEEEHNNANAASRSRMEFITFALCNRSQLIISQISTVRLFQKLLRLATPTFEVEASAKLLRRIRRSNNWVKIYSQPGSFEKFYEAFRPSYLHPENEHDHKLLLSFCHAHTIVEASGPLLAALAIHSTLEEFEQILQLCLDALQTNDWAIVYHVVQLMNGLFSSNSTSGWVSLLPSSQPSSSSSAVQIISKIDNSKVELIQSRFFVPFLERFQVITSLVAKPTCVQTTPVLVRMLPRSQIQLTRGLVNSLLAVGSLTDFNVYQCFQLITETRAVSFHKDCQTLGGLFSEMSQLLGVLAQQRPYLVINMKSSLNAILVHLLACLLKFGTVKTTANNGQQKSQMGDAPEVLSRCISGLGSLLKNLCRYREFVPLAWPVIVQYLELCGRNCTAEQVKRSLNQTIFCLLDLLRKESSTTSSSATGSGSGLQPYFARLDEQTRALFNILFEHYQHYHNYQGQV